MSEPRGNEAEMEGRGDLTQLAASKIISIIERRIQKALAGEEEWEALQQYVDSRIEAYLAEHSGES